MQLKLQKNSIIVRVVQFVDSNYTTKLSIEDFFNFYLTGLLNFSQLQTAFAMPNRFIICYLYTNHLKFFFLLKNLSVSI